jgi:hypothetical protein
MSIVNLHFFRILIHVNHPFHTYKHKLQAAMEKENCGHIDRNRTLRWIGDLLPLGIRRVHKFAVLVCIILDSVPIKMTLCF